MLRKWKDHRDMQIVFAKFACLTCNPNFIICNTRCIVRKHVISPKYLLLTCKENLRVKQATCRCLASFAGVVLVLRSRRVRPAVDPRPLLGAPAPPDAPALRLAAAVTTRREGSGLSGVR